VSVSDFSFIQFYQSLNFYFYFFDKRPMATGIVYAVVASNGNVLAEFSAARDANFNELAEKMIQRLSYSTDGKKTYGYQGHVLCPSPSAFLALILTLP